MEKHLDRLHLITVFVAVVDSSGFAGAARKLNMSPPAVTRAIGELEDTLGVRLFTRTTRQVRVTDAGTRYVEDCRRIIAELKEADESVAGLHGAPRGCLSITAPMLFGAMFVTPIVTEYLHRFSDMAAKCWFVDRVVNMMDEGVDVAVRIGELADSSMQAVQVGRVRRVICAAPSYLKERGTPVTPDDLSNHTVVLASTVTASNDWRLEHQGKPVIARVTPRLTMSTNDSAVNAVKSGFGITRLMSYQVAEHVREGRLEILLKDYEAAWLPVHLLHREGRHPSKKARAFLDLAIEKLRSNPAVNPIV